MVDTEVIYSTARCISTVPRGPQLTPTVSTHVRYDDRKLPCGACADRKPDDVLPFPVAWPEA